MKEKRSLILGSGHEDSPIVFVGDAPGEHEARLKEPFVGSEGRLLRRISANAKINPLDIYMTNVIKERPRHGMDEFIKFGKRGVTISSAYKTYENFLYKEFEDLTPNVVVALGNVAMWALCRVQGITKYRGSLLKSTTIPNTWVIPTFHPSSVLKNQENARLLHYDLSFAAQCGQFVELAYVKRDLLLGPDFGQVMDWLAAVDPNLPLAFDIEISNMEISHISLAQTPAQAISIRFYRHGRVDFTTQQETDIFIRIAELLADKKIQKVVHNAAFDATFMYERYRIITRNIWDTMVGQAISFPDMAKNLAIVNSLHTDIPYYKDEGKEQFKHGVSSTDSYITTYLQEIGCNMQNADNFDAYSALDALVLLEIRKNQIQYLKEFGNYETVERQLATIEPIIYMTQRGLRADAKALKQRSEEASVELRELQVELDYHAGRHLNSNSPKQLMEYFYKEKRITPITNRGKPTTDKDALQKLSGKGHVEARTILRMRRLGKLKSAYFDVKLDTDGRLRYSMNPVGSRFGRFSSSKDIFERGMNVQNLPYEVRQYLQPDEGYIGYELDLSQAENRIVAYVGNEIAMIGAFETGKDVHSMTAALIFEKPVEEIIQLHKEWGAAGQPADARFCPEIGGYQHDYRSWGKRANHSLNYGIGQREAAKRWECQEKDAKKIIRRYFQVYPGVTRYQEYVQTFLREHGYLENLFGRRYPLIVRNAYDYKDGYSFIAQSTVADCINSSGVLQAYHHPHCELLAQIHDSIVIQISLDHDTETHVRTLTVLTGCMEEPITTQTGQSFSIPTAVKVYPRNFRDGEEFSSDKLLSSEFQQHIEKCREDLKTG